MYTLVEEQYSYIERFKGPNDSRHQNETIRIFIIERESSRFSRGEFSYMDSVVIGNAPCVLCTGGRGREHTIERVYYHPDAVL